jgi:oligopeptidase B
MDNDTRSTTTTTQNGSSGAGTASAGRSNRTFDPSVPPVAQRRPFRRETWDEVRVDHYQWLEDRDSEDVLAHLRAENAYTEAAMAPLDDLRQTLFEEIRSRVKETDLSVPVIKDHWAYYARTIEGKSYPLHCRRPVPAELGDDIEEVARWLTGLVDASASGDGVDGVDGVAGEELLLDENLEAEGRDFFEIGVFEVSPDHRLLLWAFDDTGHERFTARLRDLDTGDDRELGLVDIGYGSSWALDNETFFYVRNDEANRPFQVWRHNIDRSSDADVLVLAEPDERFFVGIGREKDDSFIQIGVSSKVTDEVWVVPADAPDTEPGVVCPRRQGVEYGVCHHGSEFVILTNDGAENFRVMTAPDDRPGRENWNELVPGHGTVTIMDVDATASYLTLFERADGLTRIRLRHWATGEFLTIDQPEDVSTVWPGANPDYNATSLRYGYTSMVTPSTLFLSEPASGRRITLKQQEVLGGFDSGQYRTERRWAPSPDGTRVPVSMVWHVDRDPDQPGPCLLYAYGSYESSVDPTFSSARLSLLDRGFVFALAHPRGGGEMGRHWYENGKMSAKTNTFIDVEAVARMLIAEGVTSPDQLVLRGGSAGGLMAGAVMNRAPELFAGVVAQVPFVDVLTTISNPALPLTVTEWEEWGNPVEDRSIYQVMRSYSPLDNVCPQDYPSVLATAGLNDTRVSYWEAAKWVQELRRQSTSDRPILLWTDLDSGHAGPSGRYDSWREEARILAYILGIVGLRS